MEYMASQIKAEMNCVFNFLSKMPACDDRAELIKLFLEYADKLSKIKDEPVERNTMLNYMYRDAANWKTWNSVILKGEMTDEMFNEMCECCEDGHEMFVPEQLGLDLIRDWYVTADDGPYAELSDFEIVSKKPTTDMTVEELLDRFRKAKSNWHPEDYEPEIEEED